MTSWQRKIAVEIGADDDPGPGPWLRIVANAIVSIGGQAIVLGTQGSWARMILENYTGYLPDSGSWERKLRYLFDTGVTFVGGGVSGPSVGDGKLREDDVTFKLREDGTFKLRE